MRFNRYKQARLAVAAACLAASPALFAAGTGNVYVSSEDDDLVTVFDGQSMDRIDTIAVSERPRWLAFSPDHKKLYVACGDDDSIDVIDADLTTQEPHEDVGPWGWAVCEEAW